MAKDKDKEEEKKKKEEKEKEEEEKRRKEEIQDKLKKGYLRVHVLFEVVGNPPEFIEKTLAGVVEEIKNEKGIQILLSKINESKPYANEKKMFSTFAEVELLVENLKRLLEFVFDFMPSSLEIFEPEELKTKISDCNAFLNDLAVRLHKYDMTLRKTLIERDVLFRKLKEVQGKTEDKEKKPETKVEEILDEKKEKEEKNKI